MNSYLRVLHTYIPSCPLRNHCRCLFLRNADTLSDVCILRQSCPWSQPLSGFWSRRAPASNGIHMKCIALYYFVFKFFQIFFQFFLRNFLKILQNFTTFYKISKNFETFIKWINTCNSSGAHDVGNHELEMWVASYVGRHGGLALGTALFQSPQFQRH